VKRIPQDDRPREKLDRLGPAGLGDNELLAVVLGHGAKGQSALDVANVLIGELGGLHALTRLSLSDLERVPGIGRAKATQLVAAVELGRRTVARAAPARTQIGAPSDAAAFLLPRFGGQRVEQFGIVLLDTRHRVLKAAVLTRGTLDASPVHPREVFREAILGGAASVLLFHNHPSGDPTPSPDDFALTRRLVLTGQVMGIDVVDHIVLGDTTYFSLKEAGKL
jgi:DNA repair protein RadC